MRVHQYSNLNYNDRGILVGITEIQLFDVNHTFKPELSNQDVIGFFDAVAPLLGTNNNRFETPDDKPVGFRLDQEYFPALKNIIQNGEYDQGSDTIIRNILALVANLVIIPHGNVRFCHIQLYLHCDNAQM